MVSILDRIIIRIANTKFASKIKFNKFFEDIPPSFFLEYYEIKKIKINSAIILTAFFLSILSSFIVAFFEIVFAFLIFFVVFLGVILFLLRRTRKIYLNQKLEVEQYSDLICREMILVYKSTHSLELVLEYLSQSNYPIISPLILKLIHKTNINVLIEDSFIEFANKQPSETIREFILETILPLHKGNLTFDKIQLNTQWRIRDRFNSYISQIESKLSIFLAITTIIPITISMLVVMLGHINIYLLIFLPLLFFIFDLIAVEIFNSGNTKLLGG